MSMTQQSFLARAFLARPFLARTSALASAGLVVAVVAWGQAVSPSPPSGNITGGTNTRISEGETPDSTRPGVSGAQQPRLGSTGQVPGIGSSSTRTRASDNDATNGVRSTTRSTLQSESDTTRDSRDSARETDQDTRQSARDSRSQGREAADDFRDAARETTRDARGRADELRDAARDTAEDFRDTARDADRDRDRDPVDRESDRFQSERFDRDADRFSGRDEDRFNDRQFDRGQDRDRLDGRTDRSTERTTDDRFNDRQFDRGDERVLDRDSRFNDQGTARDADFRDREDRFSSDRSTITRDDRVSGSASTRSSSNFQVNNVRGPDIGLWFDRATTNGLIINDIGSGVISRWGFREGDRIYSVNGVPVTGERAFVQTLFDPRWRNQRANVVIYRHGRPWTVYAYPSQLISEYTTVATTDPLEQYGVVLDDRYDDVVVVWRVLPRSPAYYAGLRPGDVITTFDGRRISGRDDFVRLMSQGNLDTVALDVNRGRQLRRIDLDLAPVRTGARTTLRPNFDGGANIDSGTSIDSGARIDSAAQGRFDGNLDGQFDSASQPGVRTTVQPGVMVQPGVQTTVRPGGVLPRVQGGVRGGGLFRGNR